MFYDYLDTPIGRVVIGADEEILKSVSVTGVNLVCRRPNLITRMCTEQLKQYFLGMRREFNLPFRLEGTGFQVRVWTQLSKIKFGDTCSYKDIADALGRFGAQRAVGGANNRNKLAIVIPCHRVVGHKGGLTGYAGGLDKKAWLINHEKSFVGVDASTPIAGL